MERHGAAHSITATRSGGSVDPARTTRLLKGNVTRTRNKVDKLEGEYGARDVPQASPYYAKIAAARQAHDSARQAWAEHTRNT